MFCTEKITRYCGDLFILFLDFVSDLRQWHDLQCDLYVIWWHESVHLFGNEFRYPGIFYEENLWQIGG